MSTRKSSSSRNSNLSFASKPVALADLVELPEEAEATTCPPSSRPPPSRFATRKSRFSNFLRNPLGTSTEYNSKSKQDTVVQTQTREQSPLQFGNDAPPLPPPHRDAPSAPPASLHQHLPPLPPPKDSPSTLRKINSADRPDQRHPSPTRNPPPAPDLHRPADKALPPIRSSQNMGEVFQPAEKVLPLIRPVVEHGHPVPSTGSRPTSAAASADSRPGSANSGNESDGSASRGKKRMSWLPGSRSRSRHPSQEVTTGKQAWITQGGSTTEYNMTSLQAGGKVPELWVEEADTFIYLFPESSARLASFKIPSHILSSSKPLLDLMQNHVYTSAHSRNRSYGGRSQLEASDASRIYGVQASNRRSVPSNNYFANGQQTYDQEDLAVSPESPPLGAAMHLYFPANITTLGSQMEPDDVQRLIDVRNLFAFLLERPLVMSNQRRTLFEVLHNVSGLLKEYKFTDANGSSLGEAASASFEYYVNVPEFKLSEIYKSREKTLEVMVLAEDMMSINLYNEAFTHAVGKFDAIQFNKYPIYALISPTTQERMSFAVIELNKRQVSVADRLTTFEFPSIFTGIASSNERNQANIRYGKWKQAFASMRKFLMDYLKDVHGTWPPKASHKKNILSDGGLNRVVLQMLYTDICQLYTLLVDRTSFSTRKGENQEQMSGEIDSEHQALRTMLTEYDHSSPPVQPPVPFDVPLIPTVHTINVSYPKLTKKEKLKQDTRKLDPVNELPLVLFKSHNDEFSILKARNPFVLEFIEYEKKQSEGKSTQEMADARYGTWIFIYAVIQALPLLVIDAPKIQFTSGVEYFLCQPSIGNPPWMEGVDGKEWYEVKGCRVQLPSHNIENSIDAIYIRSYCWLMAEKWTRSESDTSSIRRSDTEPDLNSPLSPLKAPQNMFGEERPPSRGRSRNEEPINNFGSLNLAPTMRSAPLDQAAIERRAAQSRNRMSLYEGPKKIQPPTPINYPSHSPQITPSSRSYPMSGNSSFSTSTTNFGNPASAQYSVGGLPYPTSRTTSDGSETHSRNASASGQGGYGPSSANAQGRVGSRPPSAGGAGVNTGQTFDDILGNIGKVEQAKAKKLGKKKK